ncbi:uncharacterized protein LOC124305226 [Neodiprion virginianus]|uniref:uncharacterized protein LOC124305226 n=1 Tax=Neodiprion virginianus TaxID=2961670 RepID=UPI001EE71575|nr:uncharacterized protein LOC124305226 [Neodiprion virginianus]XP_046620347.1 uncharacterized protein LOC124305226 [Neodiprion virginianus]XP_046620348.1 uncharacterized protein LOC124305226 [Neodiprion virginianus]
MKEVLATRTTPEYNNYFANNNGDSSGDNPVPDNSTRRYAVLSTKWMGAMGEELGMHPLPDPLLRRLAEDASYRLREVLHKCVTRLKHSRRKRLTAVDVNAVLTTLYNTDPVMGAPEQLPEYHSEARVFVPHERFVNLVEHANNSVHLSQTNLPLLKETEINDSRITEARQNYTKRALKTLFNGSQKTFQVLLNDCSTNAHLGGAGVVDRLIAIARSSIISSSAQYTRVSTRTCQLIISIACNSETVYPQDLQTVDSLTELLLELLFGKSMLNQNLGLLFKECVLKLMLRWPTTAHRFLPMLETILLREDNEKLKPDVKKEMAMEIMAGVQPLYFFQPDNNVPGFYKNVLEYALPGTSLWHRLALTICALSKSGRHLLDLSMIIEHFGDSILPYLISAPTHSKAIKKTNATLPIIVRSKIKYAAIKPLTGLKISGDKQTMFTDSTLRGSRREIRFAFAGGRPVPPNSLRRASLRANYQILRSDSRATYALVASRRLLVVKSKKSSLPRTYDLANTII